MAETLAYHASNKPLFGLAKRHRDHDSGIQRELNMALVHHAGEGNEKGVMLSLWAGADPHTPIHILRDRCDCDEPDDDPDRFPGFAAVEEACHRGDAQILKRLSPDPTRDDFEELYRSAGSGEIVDVLAKVTPPKDIGAILERQLPRLNLAIYRRSSELLERLFERGARWRESSAEQIQHIRRSLLQMSADDFVDTLRLLAAKDHCAPEMLQELGRTPAMKRRLKETGFLEPDESELRDPYRLRPRRYREVVKKLGLQHRKKPESRPLPPVVVIGSRSSDAQELRLTRAELFDRVWSEPVDKLAKQWGLSGRGLAKACARLKIPVPPRGYWAKLKPGKQPRRPKLPLLKQGEATRVVIRFVS